MNSSYSTMRRLNKRVRELGEVFDGEDDYGQWEHLVQEAVDKGFTSSMWTEDGPKERPIADTAHPPSEAASQLIDDLFRQPVYEHAEGGSAEEWTWGNRLVTDFEGTVFEFTLTDFAWREGQGIKPDGITWCTPAGDQNYAEPLDDVTFESLHFWLELAFETRLETSFRKAFEWKDEA